jgi:subtilase family serine protease
MLIMKNGDQAMHRNHYRALATVALTLGLAASAFGAQPVQFVALPTRVPDVVNRSNDLGHSDPDRVLHLAVSLPYGDPAGITAFVDSVSDPASPNYRQFLTPEQVGARFGLDDKHVQSVVKHLESARFNITLVGKNRLSILADCTVAQAEKAFHTTIHEFQAVRND